VLWKLLCQWLASTSIQAAAQRLSPAFPLETVYHLLARLRHRLDAVRCRLCARQKAPASSQSDPLRQTIEHLAAVFASKPCAVSEFQLSFQQPFLG